MNNRDNSEEMLYVSRIVNMRKSAQRSGNIYEARAGWIWFVSVFIFSAVFVPKSPKSH